MAASDIAKPVATIRPQVMTQAAITTTTVLIDDPGHLVDDNVALTGSQTTPVPNFRVQVRIKR